MKQRIVWKSMKTAPTDRRIEVKLEDGTMGMVTWTGGLMDSDNNDCGGWAWLDEITTPVSWTDGICWEVNDALERSVQPVRWK